MRIDRSRFLILVSALAAGACSSTTATTGDGGATQSADGSAGGNADGSAADGATNEGGDASLGGDGSGGDDSGFDSGACNEGMGAAADCNSIATFDGGSANEGCGTTGTTECTNVNTNFKPGIASTWLSCALGSGSICGPSIYTCAKSALNAACADSTADGDCTDIVANCAGDGGAPITAADCHALVDGLSAAGRQAVVMCTQSSTVTCAGSAGLYACIEGLL